ncbi:PucR family transcriptional regulator [Nocardia thailandica]
MSDRNGVALADRPARIGPGRARLARLVAGRLADEGARVRAGRPDRSLLEAIALACVTLIDGPRDDDTGGGAAGFGAQAAAWAREGLDVGTLIRLAGRGLRAAADLRGVDPGAVAALIGEVSAVIAENCSPSAGPDTGAAAARAAVARHLLAGTPPARIAALCGVVPAARYWVLAVGPPGAETGTGLDRRVCERRRLARMEAELAAVDEAPAFAVLAAGGGTVLLSRSEDDADLPERVGRRLADAAGAPIACVIAAAPVAAVAETACRGHELLAILREQGVSGGTHRFEDHLLDYQICRPGPARDRLAAVLAPLADHPELLGTLRCHLTGEMSRRRTARVLQLHINSVDYRLRRISALTGYDLTDSRDAWYLRAALVAAGRATAGDPVCCAGRPARSEDSR